MRAPHLSLLALALVATGCIAARPGGTSGPIAGPTWSLTMLGANRLTASDASITFGPDGRVTGSTGCNRFFGSYRLAPTGALSITQVGSTRMACPGADMEQERRFLDGLASASRAAVVGNQLMLISGSDRLLTFETATTAATISGTVAYRERIALPPGAVVAVRLIDVSRADAASETVAETTVGTSGRPVPVPFTLGYDADRIDARTRCAPRSARPRAS